jgi:hypothetical protein
MSMWERGKRENQLEGTSPPGVPNAARTAGDDIHGS